MKKIIIFATTLALVPALGLGACKSEETSSSSSGGTTNDGGSSGTGDGGASGVVSGAKDEHCGAKKQVTTQAACSPDAGHSHDTDAMAMDDAGAMSEYGATLYNDEGDDDECKYHVKWTASPVAQGKDVTFTVIATNKSDGSALKAAPIRAEVFLDDTHPGPNTNQTSKESATAGTYAVGPIRFDKPGKWTVRFHFFEDCADGEESPHGHVAFYVQVP